jgi:hypothetical protein
MIAAERKLRFIFTATVLCALAMAGVWWNLPRNSAHRQDDSANASPASQFSIQNKLRGVARKAASAEWFMSQRTQGLGYISPDAEIRTVEDVRTRMIPDLQRRGMSLVKSTAAQLSWEFHGPGNLGGRLRGLLIHPNNPNLIYAGSVSGGVWKTMNGGATWSPLMNDLITLNISALAMKPGDPNTIYAGTGEGYFTGDELPGRGLLKTTDDGQTWRRIHVAQGLNSPFIMKLAVSPVNPNVVYASGRKAVPHYDLSSETVPDPGVNAIFKSNDSGETWQEVTTGKGIEHNPQSELDDWAVDVAEVSLQVRPGNTRSTTFNLANLGAALLNFNITETGRTQMPA